MGDMLKGKVCVVTGGAQGMGAEHCLRFAEEGAAVGIVDLTRMEQAKQVEAKIVEKGGKAIAIQGDITKEDQMERMAKAVVDRFGRIDCLVNNAALYQDMAGATWQMFHDVNFMGILTVSNAVIPYMWQQRSGSIIHISSIGAFPLPIAASLPVPEDAPPPKVQPGGYGMTKWMLIWLTRNMARTLGARNIRVNCVCPGYTLTEGTKKVAAPAEGRFLEVSALRTVLEPRDMTGVVLFLASDDSSKMTGQTLVNDAGVYFAD